VYNPPAVIDPQPAYQITGAEAVNCTVCPWGVAGVTGDMVIGDTMFTGTWALLPSVVDVAVIVQVLGYVPAVNNPLELMEPPHDAAHVAGSLALYWKVACSLMVWVVLGEIVTDAAATALAIKQEIRRIMRRRAFADMMSAPREKCRNHSTASRYQR
jgi:hypothetical protein